MPHDEHSMTMQYHLIRAGAPVAALVVLVVFGLAGGGCSGESAPAIHRDHTDVLMLTLCTLRADHLGVYGYEHPTSPNLDDLGRRGVVFERALTAAPWTRASIGSMITGVYPRPLGMMDISIPEQSLVLPAAFDTAAERFRDAGYLTIGITSNPNTNAIFRFYQGYRIYRDTRRLWQTGYDNDKATAEDVVKVFLEHLDGPGKGRKFFAHLVLVDVHLPYREDACRKRLGDVHVPSQTPEYDRQIRYLDAVVGDLMKELESRGRRDTLVVVNADHGEGFGPAHRPHDRHHGRYLYNSAIWAPFIVYHPALEARARRVVETVGLIDTLPTVLDLLDIPFDEKSMDGRSLAPLVSGTGAAPNRSFRVAETYFQGHLKSAILKNGWKLIVNYGVKGVRPAADWEYELYRHAEDPHEKADRAPREPERVRQLLAELFTWQKKNGRRYPAGETLAPGSAEMRALRSLGYLK